MFGWIALGSGCGPTCPPVLKKTFAGPGFLVAARDASGPVVFFPACSGSGGDVAISLRNDQFGEGVTVDLHNVDLYNLKKGKPAVVAAAWPGGGR